MYKGDIKGNKHKALHTVSDTGSVHVGRSCTIYRILSKFKAYFTQILTTVAVCTGELTIMNINVQYRPGFTVNYK